MVDDRSVRRHWHPADAGLKGNRDQARGNTAKEEVFEFFQDRVAKWWLPDDVVFLEEIPKTSVGKFSKKELRAQFEDYKMPTA